MNHQIECRTRIVHDPDGRPVALCGISTDITERLKTEDLLKLSQAKYRQLFDILIDGFAYHEIIRDADGKPVDYRFLEINPAFTRITGLTPRQVLGKSNFAALPVIEKQWFDAFFRVAVTGEPEIFEQHVKELDKIFQVSAYRPEKDKLACLFMDITQQRKTQELLELSEKKYRLLFETLMDGFAYHEIIRDNAGRPVDYRFLNVNQAFEKLTGLTAQQLLGRTVLQVIPDIEKEWIDIYGRVADTGIPEIFERFIQPLNRWYRVAAYRPETDKFVCVFQDITDQKQTQETLRKREEEYRRIVETAIEGIWVFNEHFISTYANSQAGKIFGCSTDEMVGRSILEFVFPEEVPGFKSHLGKRRSGQAEIYEQRFKKTNGAECWCVVSAVPIMDHGRFNGSFAMITDISDQKAMETYLRHSQKIEAVGRLAAGVAHDFNNQLTIIQGYCDRLMRGMSKDNPMYDSLDQIRNASLRSQATTRHLLAYSRKQILQPEIFDICEFLRDIRTPIASILGEDIRLEFSTPDAPLWTLLDRSELHQAIMNLAVNSRDAMPNGGELNLVVSCENIDDNSLSKLPEARAGRFIRLRVVDTGVGMDQKTLDQAYDPFFTTKEVGKGTGLGLPMVQGFVSQSQGFMNIQSQPGKGTTVCLYFPQTSSPAAEIHPISPLTPASHSPPKGTLLVVEDEEAVRKLIVSTLKELGHQVLSAPTPKEALEIAANHPSPIDLLISDMIMPGMKGVELSRQLMELRPSIKTLFITGYSPDIDQPGAEIIMKPFRSGELIDAVSRLLNDGASKKT